MKGKNKYNTKIIKIKPIKINFNFDSDRDGVVDRKDCRPFNPWKQDVEPNIQLYEEIKSLPIFISEDDDFYLSISSTKYHILSKKAQGNKKLRTIRKIALSVIKRYPQIIGIIKRLRPNAVVFCAGFLGSGRGTTFNDARYIVIPIPNDNKHTEREVFNYLSSIKSLLPKKTEKHLEYQLKNTYGYKDDTRIESRKKVIKSMGWTTLHELQHIKQIDKEKEPKLFSEKYMQEKETINKREKEKLQKGTMQAHYNPYEIEAQEFAYQETKKLERKERDIPKKFGIWIEENEQMEN